MTGTTKRPIEFLIVVFLFWIMWSKLLHSNQKPSWEYMDAFDTRKDCENAIGLEVKKQISEWKDAKEFHHGLRFITEGGYAATLRYICVPDTVDPRPRFP
jgi:hypothetical protein